MVNHLKNITIRLAASRINGERLNRLFGFLEKQTTVSTSKLTRLIEDLYESDKQDGIHLRKLWDEINRLEAENLHLKSQLKQINKLILVPKEPTEEMLEAARVPKGLTMDGYPISHTMYDKYKAMIAAAPKINHSIE